MKKIPLLTTDDIEVKIKQVTKAGALALLYKTARVDRRILNEIYGPLNWTSDYKVVKDNLYCGIGIREDANQEFVWKWDCGIESRADDEGNEKKGEASDAFKRAGFAVGIGEELYSSPFIWLNVNTKQNSNGKWELEDPYTKYIVTGITYNESTRVITSLEISNAKTNVKVFSWEMPTTGAVAAKMSKTTAVKKATPAEKPAKEPVSDTLNKPEVNTSPAKELSLAELKSAISKIVINMNKEGNLAVYNEVTKSIAGPGFKCKDATEDQYPLINKIYHTLLEKGY